MESRRIDRIEEQIRIEISEIIEREIQDPRVGLVTITGVKVSRDGSHARIFVSGLGGSDEHKKMLQGLKSASHYLRHSISQRLAYMRRVPELTFAFDESIERGNRIEALLDQIKPKEES